MRWFAMIAVCALAAAGCKKPKPPAVPDVTPEPGPVQKGDAQPAPQPAPSGGGGGGGGSGAFSPVGGGGFGAAQAVRKAARRTQSLNELKNLGEIIHAMHDELGRMPTVPQILEALKTAPQLLAAITEGAYILTGTTEVGGLYAFEVDADTIPGVAVIGGRAARTTPDELRPYLAALPRPVAPPAPAPMGKIDNRGGAPQPAPPQPAAVFPPVNQKDMEDVRIFIDSISTGGQMPTPQQTTAALQQSGSPALALVQKGAIILTGVQTRDGGLWAYETAALQRGGLACGANGTETLTAAELRRRLGR